jgi:AraC family transcriptional regulator
VKIEAQASKAFFPTISDYTYWKKKTHFLLETDQYPEWTLFAIEDGSFSFEIGSHTDTARFGDIVICPPNEPMTRRLIEPLTFHFISFSWDETVGFKPSPNIQPTMPTGKISFQDMNQLLINYANLRKLEERIDPISYQWRNILLANLFYAYFNESNLEQSLLIKADPLIEKARTLLHQEMFSPLNIKDIARRIGLSSVQFSRRFHTYYGITPIQYITSLRIQKGKILLQETTLTLEKIAEACGYASGYYFSRVFSLHMSMSPSQYRKLHR